MFHRHARVPTREMSVHMRTMVPSSRERSKSLSAMNAAVKRLKLRSESKSVRAASVPIIYFRQSNYPAQSAVGWKFPGSVRLGDCTRPPCAQLCRRRAFERTLQHRDGSRFCLSLRNRVWYCRNDLRSRGREMEAYIGMSADFLRHIARDFCARITQRQLLE